MLNAVDSAKYFGIIIFKDMECHTQICSVISNANATGSFHGACYLRNDRFIDLEATMGTYDYELRSYCGDQ